MLSVKPSSQKEDMPKTESEDAVMSDQKIAEVQSQDQALDDVDDMQVISEDQFNNPRGSELAKDHKAAASELPGETSVKQKSNTEGLRVQVRVLNDQLGAIDRDQQIRDRELKQAQAQLATTKQALQKSKAQWKRQNEVVKKLRANLKESKDKVRGMGVTNSDLQEKLVTSEEELTRCRDDVFSLQPMVLVADSTIVEELEIVREGVVHWIETEVTSFEKAHPEAEEEHIFSVGDDEEAAIFLAQHPGAGEHLARYLIHRFFKANLFGSRYDVLGLTEETARLLQKAEHSMAHADPPKGTSYLDNGVSNSTTDDRQILLE